MKNVLILSIALLAAIAPAAANAQLFGDVDAGVPPLLCGDANADGQLNATDSLAILHFVVGLALPSGHESVAADVDLSGHITADDALLVLHAATGLPVSLHCVPFAYQQVPVSSAYERALTVVPKTCGDVDGDGELTRQDAEQILFIATGGDYDPLADLDRSGTVTASDALLALQQLEGVALSEQCPGVDEPEAALDGSATAGGCAVAAGAGAGQAWWVLGLGLALVVRRRKLN